MSLQKKNPAPLNRNVDYAKWTDTALIQACQRREQVPFEHLRKRYMRSVSGVICRLSPERQDTDDLIQEVFIRVWQSIQALRNPLAFRSWLNHIVTNCFYDELRHRLRQQYVYIDCPLTLSSGSETVFTQIPDSASQPDQLAEVSELASEIQLGLVKLNPSARKIILLRMDGLSYEEIASQTHTALGTVKSRLCRARLKLKTTILDLNNAKNKMVS